MSDRVAVIGAGPAGLAAAYVLGKHGVAVDVFEAGPVVGGMSRTFDLWDQRVDLGPHRFFSADARVNRLWLEVVGTDYRMVDRITRIYYDGRFFEYPLRLADSLPKLGAVEAARCVLSYLRRRRLRSVPAESFEDWVCDGFGTRLYEIFFRSYSEKVWGVPCANLDAEFAAQRIRKLSLLEAARSALLPGGRTRHATLVDRFAYPLGGTGSVYRRMADHVESRGGAVRLRSPVERIARGADGTLDVALAGGERRAYEHVVSSMPLTHLVRSFPGAPERVLEAAAALRFRNTILVYLRVAARDLFPDQWIYVHAPELECGRITNYRNWVPELHGDSPDTIVSLELWCHPEEERWREPDERLAALAERDLRATGLVGDAPVTAAHVVRVPRCYPIYDLGYRRNLSVLQEYVDAIPGLHAIGRQGSFKYNNQDHSLLMGMLAAENVAFGSGHDLWSINEDDAYQEAAIIDETGLVPQPA
jgi:protoporphyrinogen oxidase